jgi:peroxiredoxin
MKQILLYSLILFATVATAQTTSMTTIINGKKHTITQNSIVLDTAGKQLTYEVWSGMMFKTHDLVPMPMEADSVQKYLLKPLTPEMIAKRKEEMEKRMAMRKNAEFSVGSSWGNFTATDITGRKWTKEELKGKVIFISYWSVVSASCISEIPSLMKLKKDYDSDNFVFFAITPFDDADLIKKTIEKYSFNFHHFSKEAAASFRESPAVQRYPTYILVDKKGVIRFTALGMIDENMATLKTEINKHLNSAD